MKKLLLAFLITASVLAVILKSDASILGIVSPKSTNTDEIVIVSTGDIGLVRDINYKIKIEKNPNYPFLNIASYLKDSDLAITNLEGPLIDNCPIIRSGFIFCGESSNADGLVYSGIDAVNLANNHTTNYGISGLNATVESLSSKNISSFGLNNQIKYMTVKNKIIALLGFVELGNNWGGLNNATVNNVSSLVKKAKNNSDIVIVAFHWGVEYTRKPTSNQIFLAHTAIDSGADIVLGNHPHWIQTNEIYKGKFITYAQGNTIFDQDWSQETKEGVLYKFVYRNGAFEKIDERYTIIENNSQPRFASGQESDKIKKKLQ